MRLNFIVLVILFISGCGSSPLTQQQRLQQRNWQNAFRGVENSMYRLQDSINSNPPIVYYPVGGSNNQNSTYWQETTARQQYYKSLGYGY